MSYPRDERRVSIFPLVAIAIVMVAMVCAFAAIHQPRSQPRVFVPGAAYDGKIT